MFPNKKYHCRTETCHDTGKDADTQTDRPSALVRRGWSEVERTSRVVLINSAVRKAHRLTLSYRCPYLSTFS